MRHGFPLFLCKNIHSIPYPIESSILVPFMAMRIIIPRSHAELEEGLLPLGRIRHSQTEEKSQKHLHCNSMYRGIVYGYGQNLSGNAIRKQFYFYFDSKKIVPLCFKYCCTLTSLPSKTPAVRQVTVSFKNDKAMGQQSALLKRNSHPNPSPLQAPVADKCCRPVLLLLQSPG